jgi:hypothetical protein
LHDLRRTLATNLQRLHVDLQVVETILGHVGGSRAGIVGVYQRHRYQAEMRAALETWAGEVDRIVRGKKPPKIVFAAARFKGEGGLSAEVEVRSVDREWLAAITLADATNSPDHLIAYLHRPGAELGPAESFLLRLLLERVQFKRAKGGNYVPLGQQSSEEQHRIGAAHVRDLQQRDGLKRASAIDRTVQVFPDWFSADGGLSLTNFMKRGAH